MDEPATRSGRPLPRPIPDDRLEHVAGGAGTISPAQLQAILRTGAVPDPAGITAGSVSGR